MDKSTSEFWDFNSYNPSARCQATIVFSQWDKVLKKSITLIFAKFPNLVTSDVKIDFSEDIQYDKTIITLSWRTWIPTLIMDNLLTLEKKKIGFQVRLSNEMLEGEPELISMHFKYVLNEIEIEMNTIQEKFADFGVDSISTSFFLRRCNSNALKVPVLSSKRNLMKGIIP